MTDAQNPAAPADVDTASLAGQLERTPVAFGTSNPVNAELGPALERALATADTSAFDPVAVVVLEHTPPHIPDLRDIAQDIAIESGYDTVLVRTPSAAVGVSDSLTRAQIEQGQRAMVAQPDYVAGVQDFVATANDFAVPWAAVMVCVVLGAAAVVAAVAMQTRRTR